MSLEKKTVIRENTSLAESSELVYEDQFTDCPQAYLHANLINQANDEAVKDVATLPTGNRIGTGICGHHAVVNYDNFVITNRLIVENRRSTS
ncbi:MAG: hypothetical protein AAB557_06105 [Patescibacteria group bacterium]